MTMEEPRRLKRHFEADLREVKRQILEMGGTVESMIADATRHLVDRDADAAVRVLSQEREVNRLQNGIDEACLRVLALHQPLAGDLRFLAAVMKMTADLERMGDLAVNVVQGTRRLASEAPVGPFTDLPRIARLTAEMVHAALNALVERDEATARKVLEADSEVDSLKHQIFRELIDLMRSNPDKVPGYLQLILISRHYERIADHATNIAEEVIYIVSGRDVRHHQENHIESSDDAHHSKGD